MCERDAIAYHLGNLGISAYTLLSDENINIKDIELLKQFKEVEKLNSDDKHLIKTFIDAFITKRKI